MLKKIQKIFFCIIIVSHVFSCQPNKLENACDPRAFNQRIELLLIQLYFGSQKGFCGESLSGFNTSNSDIVGFSLNQTAGTVSESGTSLSVGSTFTININLTSKPAQNVLFTLTSTNTSYGLVSPSTLTFNSGNWNTFQEIRVTGVNNATIDGTRNFEIKIDPSTSSDPNYAALNFKIISMSIIDNDKKIFQTTTTHQGNLGGVAGADAICQSDAGCGSGKVCKAIIGDRIGSRIASITPSVGDGQVSWVLLPFAHYYQGNGTTLISNTNATSLLVFPFTNFVAATLTPWSGFIDDGQWEASTDHCLSWTSNSVGQNGGEFISSGTTMAAFFAPPNSCNNSFPLLCAEQ